MASGYGFEREGERGGRVQPASIRRGRRTGDFVDADRTEVARVPHSSQLVTWAFARGTICEAAGSQIRLVTGYMTAINVSTGMRVGIMVCMLFPNRCQTDVNKQHTTGLMLAHTPFPGYSPHLGKHLVLALPWLLVCNASILPP